MSSTKKLLLHRLFDGGIMGPWVVCQGIKGSIPHNYTYDWNRVTCERCLNARTK